MKIVTITATTPALLVRETAAATPVPARLMVRADTTFAPAVGTRVIVEQVAGRLYVLGVA